VPAVVVDGDGIVQWGNAGAAALLGLGQTVPSGFRLAEVVAEDAPPQGALMAREVALYRSDGSVVWVGRSSAPLPWGDKLHILHLLWDMTDRRQREAVCQAEAARWKGIFDAFDVGILVADDVAVVDANPAWARLTGLPRPVAGDPVTKAVPWSVDGGDGPQLNMVGGRALLISRSSCPDDGTWRMYSVVDAHLALRQGVAEGRAVVLRVGQMVLERIWGMFSPLVGRSDGRRMQVESLQAFVRLRLEEGEAPQWVALDREVRGLVEEIRGLGQAWGVAVHTAIGPLPPLVRVPRWTLMQAITQTLWGACLRSQGSRCVWGIEALDAGSGKVRLKVVVHMPGTAPRWPIPEDEVVEAELLDQENLFFTVAALAVHRLGGSPREARPQPRGVEVSWSVPLEVAVVEVPTGDAPEDASQISGESAATPPGPPQPLRVVVAEDNPFNAALLEDIMMGLGTARVALVEDGEKLVELLEATPDAFDVLLVDVEMPQKNGVEAVRHLRKQGLRIPVVGLTAHGDEATQQQCLEAGMDAVLTKPYQPQEIAAIFRRWHWI
jgi:CheY-like chemotaxis protein/PAS domain-containing protein